MKIRTEGSNKWVIETHKPIISTVIFFISSSSDDNGVLKLIFIKFIWWKWGESSYILLIR